MISVHPNNNVLRTDNAFDGLSSQCRQNEKRCKEMLECKRQIEFWTTKLERLEEEHALQLKLAHIRHGLTHSFWESLSSEDRNRKDFILEAMKSKTYLPSELYDFPNNDFPRSLRADKDILLARVARDDFERKYDDERLWVPPELRGDKEVIVAILPKNYHVIEKMSEELRDDDDIFLTMLRSHRLPNLALQHFSERIRSHKELLLKLFAHIDGMQSLQFASSDLRNDKEFMLEVIHAGFSHKAHYEFQIKREFRGKERSTSIFEYFPVLRYVSQRLQDDYDIVLAAVAKSGASLKYASYNLRRDLTIVTAAIETSGDAFHYCLPGETKECILSDRKLVLNKIVKNRASTSTIQACLDRYENDHEMILEAVRGGVDRSSLPLELQNSPEIIKLSLLANSESYLQLPLDMQQDFEFARAAVEGDWFNESVVVEAIKRCPRLLSNSDFFLAILNECWFYMENKISKMVPKSILADKETMLQALKNDFWNFDYCAEELKTDRDFVLETFARGSPLVRVPHSFQLENPDAIIAGIQNCDKESSGIYKKYICRDLWSNRDFAIAWVSKFGTWCSHFPDEFEDDEELCLILAKEGWEYFSSSNFFSPLKDDKEFMLKAISMNARNIEALDDETNWHLKYDDDLSLLAFSKDKRAIQFYSDGEDFEYMVSFTKRIRKRIRKYEKFDEVIYQNILRVTENNQDCPLLLLNQGPDVTRLHTNLIASYLGIPDKEELQMLLAASDNLLHWGF